MLRQRRHRTVDPTAGRMGARTGQSGGRMADLTFMADRTAAHTLVARITAIGSSAGRAGFMATAISGEACGIAGIRTATTARAGTFAALTGNQRSGSASGVLPLASFRVAICYSGISAGTSYVMGCGSIWTDGVIPWPATYTFARINRLNRCCAGLR